MTGMRRAMSSRRREASRAKTKRTMIPVIRSTTTMAEDLTKEVEYLAPSHMRTTSPPTLVGRKVLKNRPTM